MVGVGGWCAPKARARKDGLPKEMACRGIGVSPKQGMRLQRKSQAAWTRNPCYEKNQITWRCAAKGWRGRPQSPLLASAEANPLLSEKSRYGRQDQQFGRAHLARHSTGEEKAAWGRSCGSAKLLAGTLRCLRLCGLFLWSGRPWNSWGVAPNPTRELRPLTPQGGFPLDPFWAARLERFSLTGSSSTL